MSLKLKDPNTLTYPSKAMRWEEEKEDMENVSDEAMDSSANVTKKKRRPTSLCIECPVCGGPAPDHLHFGGQSCYSCRAFFRRTSPRPVSSFSCRSGLNNCSINSGSKSCIPCRLTKCLQIGMDPAMVRGKKSKVDSDNDDTANNYDDKDKPNLAKIPSLAPIINSKPFEESQESLLRLRADVLEYQGLCLQYQASILEKQARSMGDNKEDTFYTNTMEVVDHKDFQPNTGMEQMKSEPEYEAGFLPDYESKYSPPIVEYGVDNYLNRDNEGRCKQYDFSRYPSNGRSPINTEYQDAWIRDNEYRLKDYEYIQRDNEFTQRDYEYTQKDNKFTQRDNEYTQSGNEYIRRDRSPIRMQTELKRNNAPHYANIPRSSPNKHLEESDTREEASRCESAGPLDLSIKKSTPALQLHTQAHNMPRIFFRLEQNRL